MNLVFIEFNMRTYAKEIVHVCWAEAGANASRYDRGLWWFSIRRTTRSFGRLAHGIGKHRKWTCISDTVPCNKRKPQYVGSGWNGELSAGYPRKTLSWRLSVLIVPTAGGNRLRALEFGVRAIQSLSMEGRMTVFVNMAIEGGARVAWLL